MHWNFSSDTPDGSHPSDAYKHGTPVAGLAVAEGNNARGIAGIAPESRFASWVIHRTNGTLSQPFVGADQLAKMFRFHMNEVAVQNHSWVKPGNLLVPLSPVEDEAITDATQNGRSGRGVVVVRAAGNDREETFNSRGGRNANDDAYTSDWRVITVGALGPDGVVASYSTPGAPILVSAPGGESGVASLFTTDRLGQKGYNAINFIDDPNLSDYVFSGFGFIGTSAAAPLVSGIAALMLSQNPALTYRDVQQVLIHSAYQTDLHDPDVRTNGAGFLVSHNVGFGLVNAGTAVDLARSWSNRPALTSIRKAVERQVVIPDAGLRVLIHPVGSEMPDQNIIAFPSLGPHVEDATANLPLVFVGDAVSPLATNLQGKAALIRRGGAPFSQKIQNAADAGASFAIMFNNQDTTNLLIMGRTDLVPIPAVFISQQDGENLASLLDRFGAQAEIRLESVSYQFDVSEALLCEHVHVTVNATHPQRTDMRVTLLSPAGTRSVLQRLGPDLASNEAAFPGTWTYMTTHHFYESSQGAWRLFFSDEGEGSEGTVQSVTLEVRGVPIKDSDRDGLDDDWEKAHFGALTFGPKDDPDQDGYSNAREQILGTDPARNERVFAMNLSRWNDSIVRLNWPSRPEIQYEVLAGGTINEPLSLIEEGPGGFPRTAWFGQISSSNTFFQIREKR